MPDPYRPAIDVFAGIPDQQLRLAGRRRRFDRAEVVFHRDDPGDGVHRVEHGHFAAKILTAVGDVATVALYAPGEIFGLLAVVGCEPRRTATVSALEASETLTVSTSAYRQLRTSYPDVGEATERLLAAQLAETSDRLVEALYSPVTKRIQARLADLAKMYAQQSPGNEPIGRNQAGRDAHGDQEAILIPLSQDHLAGLAGTTRETVNRVLKLEAAGGHLELARNRIVILDPARYLD